MSPAESGTTALLGALATGAVLAAESRRLPAQNIAALALLSLVSGGTIEWVAALQQPEGLARRGIAAIGTAACLLASRPMARFPVRGIDHLFARTWIAAWAMATAAGFDGGAGSLLEAATRTAGIPAALLLLAPWWINKRLAPAHTPDWAAFVGPASLLSLATLHLAVGNLRAAAVQTVVGSFAAGWILDAMKRKSDKQDSPSA